LKRILLDQGLPRSALKSLKKAGWDALHTGDIGLHMAADKEIIEYARHEDRVRRLKNYSFSSFPFFLSSFPRRRKSITY